MRAHIAGVLGIVAVVLLYVGVMPAKAALFGHPISELIRDFPNEYADPGEGAFYASCVASDPKIANHPVDAFLIFPQGPTKTGRDAKVFLFWAVHDRDGYIFVNSGDVTITKDDLDVEAGQGGLGTDDAMRRIALPLSKGNLRLRFSAADVFRPPHTPCNLAPSRY